MILRRSAQWYRGQMLIFYTIRCKYGDEPLTLLLVAINTGGDVDDDGDNDDDDGDHDDRIGKRMPLALPVLCCRDD